MASRRASVEQAAALHRRLAAVLEVATQALEAYTPQDAPTLQYTEQYELAGRLRAAAAELVPGWLGGPLDTLAAAGTLPAPGTGTRLPGFVRLGSAQPVEDADFPVVVPLLGTGNLAIDADARDRRAAGLLRSLLVRLIAAAPAGSLQIRPVDATGTFLPPFRALAAAGLMGAPAGDREGLHRLLAGAEEWVRAPGRQMQLLVISSLPELTKDSDLARIADLARAGPARRLHLIVAGWPPPPLTSDTAQPPLAHTTQVTLRNPYALVGDPPGGAFSTEKGLNSPVYLDPAPPVEVIQQVCAALAAAAPAPAKTRSRGGTVPGATVAGGALAELLPQRLWRESAAQELAVTVGLAGEAPLALRLSDLTPNWLVGGALDTDRRAFLTNVLYGLSTRYGPEELALYLLDVDDGSDADKDVVGRRLAPTPGERAWVPHVRAAATRADREYALSVLRTLDAEMAQRAAAGTAPGPPATEVTFPAVEAGQAPGTGPARPRIVCVIDEFDVLVRGTDLTAHEACELLDGLARRGRAYGIHLICSTASLRGLEPLFGRRDATLGQFPVRIALAGGAHVLDTRNHAADSLPAGEAVVNTASGLGGPVGASRAHERVVTFPDPLAEPQVLAGVRTRLWEARRGDAAPPHLYDGRAAQRLPASLPVTEPPTAYVGRVVDVALPLAGFELRTEPGRHLAVIGPSEQGADVLDSAARSLAAQHPPGSVEFLLAAFAAARGSIARQLDESLRAVGHRSRLIDAAGFKEAVSDPALSRTYLIGFGLDAAPVGGLGQLLAEGPARGVHLIGWWRGTHRFREESAATRVGLVILNVPAAEAALLVGDAARDWQPRPNRALLHDPHADRTVLIQPFVQSGQSR